MHQSRPKCASDFKDERELAAYLKQLCSDVTLCTPDKGFFAPWLQQFHAHISSNFLDTFEAASSDLERVRQVWSVKPIHTIKMNAFRKEKSGDASLKLRNEGNQCFQKKKYDQALALYSQAIVKALPNDTSLSLSYGNRSAVLLHLGEFELAVEDINLAIESSYPKNLHYKILDRMGSCHEKLKKWKEAGMYFRESFKALDFAELGEDKMAAWKSDLDKKMAFVAEAQEKLKSPEAKHPNQEDDDSSIKFYLGRSQALPNASSGVEVKYSQEMGKYACATRDIPAGQVLVSEEPFAAVLDIDKAGGCCTHCFRRLRAPIPCPWCSGVGFCSRRCMKEATQSYHRWECPFQDLLQGSGMSMNCYLALRIISGRTLEYFQKIEPELRKPLPVPSPAAPHDPGSYRSIFLMASLAEDRSTQDFIQRTLMACFLLKVLQRAHYFGPFDEEETPPDASLQEEELLIGSLLLRNLQVLQFNAHEVSGMLCEKDSGLGKSRSFPIGLAAYPTVSFFNHSCYPGVTRYFRGRKMVVISLRAMKSGEMIAENYGPVFTHHNMEDRKKKLQSRYWFDCSCEACCEKWPLYANLPAVPMFRCQKCGTGLSVKNKAKQDKNNKMVVVCNCGTRTSFAQMMMQLQAVRKDFDAGYQCLEEGKRESAIEHLFRFVNQCDRLVAPPYKDLHATMETLRLLVGGRGDHIDHVMTSSLQ